MTLSGYETYQLGVVFLISCCIYTTMIVLCNEIKLKYAPVCGLIMSVFTFVIAFLAGGI